MSGSGLKQDQSPTAFEVSMAVHQSPTAFEVSMAVCQSPCTVALLFYSVHNCMPSINSAQLLDMS